MVRYEFGLTDLARLRFAISPMWELVISLRALRDPSEATMHLPWVRSVRERVRGLDLLPLLGLVPLERLHPRLPHAAPQHPAGELRGRARRDPLDPDRTRAHGGRPATSRTASHLSLAEPFLRHPRRVGRASRRLAGRLLGGGARAALGTRARAARGRSDVSLAAPHRGRPDRTVRGPRIRPSTGATTGSRSRWPTAHDRRAGGTRSACSCPPSSRRGRSPSPRPTGSRR